MQSKNIAMIAVAITGIAARVLKGGKTVHSMFIYLNFLEILMRKLLVVLNLILKKANN